MYAPWLTVPGTPVYSNFEEDQCDCKECYGTHHHIITTTWWCFRVRYILLLRWSLVPFRWVHKYTKLLCLQFGERSYFSNNIVASSKNWNLVHHKSQTCSRTNFLRHQSGAFHTAATRSWLCFIGYALQATFMKWISHCRYAKKYCDMPDTYQNFVITTQQLLATYPTFHSFKTYFNT